MTMPPILPDWIPWWAQLALLVMALLFAVALLMMPFAVFGLKGRLDLLEAQLDDIHAELRMLAMRLPDAEPQRMTRRPPAEADNETAPTAARRRVRRDDRPDEPEERARPLRASDRPGIEPAVTDRDGQDRSEPRLRWPPGAGGR